MFHDLGFSRTSTTHKIIHIATDTQPFRVIKAVKYIIFQSLYVYDLNERVWIQMHMKKSVNTTDPLNTMHFLIQFFIVPCRGDWYGGGYHMY